MSKKITAATLRKVCYCLTMNEDIDWTAIIEGTHPDVIDLEARLDEEPTTTSQEEDSLFSFTVLSTLPGHSGLCDKNEHTGSPSSNASFTEPGSSSKENLKRKQTAKLRDLEATALSSTVNAQGCAISGTRKRKIDLRRKPKVIYSKEEFKEITVLVELLPPGECEKLRQKQTPSIDVDRPVMKTQSPFDEDETQDVCNGCCGAMEGDKNEDSPDLFETAENQEEVVKFSDASNEMPTVNEVQQLVRHSQHLLKDLTETNRRLRDDINIPMHEATEGTNDESGTRIQNQRNNEKKKGWLAAQQNAVAVEWSSDDESIDDSFAMSARYQLPKKKTRTFWTEQEMDWIREGVRKFGVGDWASVREYYPFQAAHLSSVAIKDKYRNMKKNGQI